MPRKFSQGGSESTPAVTAITVQAFAKEVQNSPSTVRDTFISVGIEPSGDIPCLDIAVALYRRSKRKELDKEKLAAKQRKEEAQAELAEISLMKEKNLLMLRSDASRIWADGFVRLRQTLDECDFIPAEDRQKLSAKLMEIQIGDLPLE